MKEMVRCKNDLIYILCVCTQKFLWYLCKSNYTETHFFSFTFYNGYNAVWQLIDYSAKIFNQPVILTSIENSYFTEPMLFN